MCVEIEIKRTSIKSDTNKLLVYINQNDIELFDVEKINVSELLNLICSQQTY